MKAKHRRRGWGINVYEKKKKSPNNKQCSPPPVWPRMVVQMDGQKHTLQSVLLWHCKAKYTSRLDQRDCHQNRWMGRIYVIYFQDGKKNTHTHTGRAVWCVRVDERAKISIAKIQFAKTHNIAQQRRRRRLSVVVASLPWRRVESWRYSLSSAAAATPCAYHCCFLLCSHHPPEVSSSPGWPSQAGHNIIFRDH